MNSTLAPTYQIVTNSMHRNIIVISDVTDLDQDQNLEFEDFDAIFVNFIDPILDRIMLALRLASPLLSEKCRFKPCFVTSRLKGWLGNSEIIVDGYATTPLDSSMTQGIEEIYGYMRRCNFLLGTAAVVTHAEEMFRLCRYSISRGKYSFTSQPTPGISTGYMALYYYTLWNENQENMQQEERQYFLKQMLDLGYIRQTRFIERIHVCPVCRRSNLLYFESCPKCNSSNLRNEPVIHHFRYAHVAPASDYESDGELICPKCRKELRHIGVDYDKPAHVYKCLECNESFMYSEMRVLCADRGHKFTPDDLTPIDVVEYEFTPDGIRAFANNDVQLSISQVGFYGYSSMRDFLDYLRMESTNTKDDGIIIVTRYKVTDVPPDPWAPPGSPSPLANTIKRLFNYKSALQGNDFYFLRKVLPGEVSSSLAQMQFEIMAEFGAFRLTRPDFNYEFVEEFQYQKGKDVEVFIQRLTQPTYV